MTNATTALGLLDVGAQAGAVTAVVTALLVTWKLVAKVRRARRIRLAARAERERLHEERLALIPVMANVIDDVLHEVRPNGQSSLRDAVDRVEGETRRQSAMLIETAADLNHLRQFQLLLAQEARHGMLKADAAGSVTWANQTLCRLLGRSAEELLGNNWVNALVESWRDRTLREWNRALEFERGFDATTEFQHTDGHRFLASLRFRAMTSPAGDVIGWVCFVYKIDGLHTKPEQLLAENARGVL